MSDAIRMPDRYVVLDAPVLLDITDDGRIWIGGGVEGALMNASPAQLRYWADLLEVEMCRRRLAS